MFALELLAFRTWSEIATRAATHPELQDFLPQVMLGCLHVLIWFKMQICDQMCARRKRKDDCGATSLPPVFSRVERGHIRQKVRILTLCHSLPR